MRKRNKIVLSVSCVAASAVMIYISNQRTKFSEVISSNIEALVSGDDNHEPYYQVTKYELAKKLRITNLSGTITGFWLFMIIETPEELANLNNLASQKGITFTTENVDCHKRVCLDTTIAQNIECLGNAKHFEMCHSSCDHSNNQY
jgi:hypothetical protein